MIEIRSLNNVDQNILLNAFIEAFADYELILTKDQIGGMLNRRGFIPDMSFGAFEGERLVAFTFNAIGKYEGVKTAYDTGTGTVPEYRGKGLAGRVFKYSLPYLKAADVEQYLLEVLTNNTKAISVYEKIGFEMKRTFNYYDLPKKEIKLNYVDSPGDIVISEIAIDQCSEASMFYDFNPSWQNSLDSIKRSLHTFKQLGAYADNELVGIVFFEPNSGDIAQLAVSKEHRRRGVGTLLLHEALVCIGSENIKILNTDTNNVSMRQFLEFHHIQLSGSQFEMTKNL